MRTHTARTITVGPFGVFYTNVNRAMGLRAHSHTAWVSVVYGYPQGEHGFPSFQATNAALLDRIHELTDRPFRDATNEDAVERLFDHLDGWVAPVWEQWGGVYWLAAVHFDVVGVLDQLGHDASTTRYTVARSWAPPPRGEES